MKGELDASRKNSLALPSSICRFRKSSSDSLSRSQLYPHTHRIDNKVILKSRFKIHLKRKRIIEDYLKLLFFSIWASSFPFPEEKVEETPHPSKFPDPKHLWISLKLKNLESYIIIITFKEILRRGNWRTLFLQRMSPSLIKLLGTQFGRHEDGKEVSVQLSPNSLPRVIGLYFASKISGSINSMRPGEDFS